MEAYAKIKKSRSKKNPLKVVVIGKNGEPLMSPELLSTPLNVKKNLLATMKAFNGTSIPVLDQSGKKEKKYLLHADGLEEYVV